MTITRRAAFSTIAAAPVAAVSTAALAVGTAEQIDPVLAARDAWREAERAMDAAYDRAEAMKRPPYPREHLGTVRDLNAPGGIREIYATDLHALTPAAEKEGAFIGRDFAGEMPEAERREKYERLRVALEKRDRAVTALEDRVGLTVARQAVQDAHRAFLDTPATTSAGIAAKLRAIDTDCIDNPEIDAALRDLDRTDAPQIAIQGQEVPKVQNRGQTEVERLYARFMEALRASESSATDEILDRRAEITNAAQLALIEAQPVTPRDVALQVLSFRDSLEISGPFPDRMMAQLHALTEGAA